MSKLEQDTYLRTATGTLAYSAPELFGLLPRRLRPRDVYTNVVDMWSLGCLVHEMLTTERPFLELLLDDDPESSMQFDTMECEQQSDIDLIIEFCRDLRDFPDSALPRSSVSASETNFVKALLVPDPRLRLSEVDALASPWISGESESGRIEAVTAMQGFSHRLTHFVAKNSLQMFYPVISEERAGRAE